MRLAVLATGDSIHSARWVAYFAERGYDVSWCSLAAFEHSTALKVRHYRLAHSSVEVVQAIEGAVRLRRLLRVIRPDVLQVHSAGWNGLVAALVGFRPCVLTAWGSEILVAARSPLKRPLVAWALRSADVVTCDAQHMRRSIIALGVPEARIRVIHFGTDTDRFRPLPPDAGVCRSLNLDDADGVVISLRSLEPIYNVESLIRAIPSVLQRQPRAVFLIVGDGSERGRLIRLAETLGVAGHTRFTGRVRNDQLAALLSVAHVYVSTALSDAGLAASTAEAMACGLPVVITDSGENRLWVNEGVGGFLVPVGLPDRLGERIGYLLDHPEIRAAAGRVNREVIERRNNYLIEMAKVEEVYRTVVRLAAPEAGAQQESTTL